ncbi:MAG: glutathione peroxidase [Alphaproteobacteria bacterium]|nr:glutathione peroxidase [Alphaproteobacteria bacterium]
MHTLLVTLLLAGGFALAADPVPAAEQAATGLAALEFTQLDGTKLAGADLVGKTVLFVNVASKCGYTPQYEGLQALYAAHEAQGLVIVAQPSNQFGAQEPGDAEEIASFCKLNYGVTFPLLEKGDVNGPKRTPLYAWLVDSKVGGHKNIRWNFEKFVVSPAGEVVARFGSATKPDDPKLVEAITAALPTRG